MTVVGLIRVVQQVLVRGILYSVWDKIYRLTFMAVFSIKVVIAYFFTLAFISVINKF